jgi:hypothetical protein
VCRREEQERLPREFFAELVQQKPFYGAGSF